ncbi:MAG: late competence development ComFB family protein [Candidatus Omnitrophica bacterium]|jgi:chemotaxis methyl-accepting protein methylase|nr:late competence development ComFB family protein [Candidatus Omnitrophota bacterium]MDD5079298.1 late competence development ComFB family protein [Candidatus Omnitrophota bacterium]MDD5775905.1 late competence development ComFB family protein [Candidatus Omnitrophota bacterium]
MSTKLKNIIEDVAKDCLNNALTLRYDICTCQSCKNDMLAFILSRIPAKYVTTEQGALHTVIQQTRIEHQAEIARAVIAAIDTISLNPRHQIKEDKMQTFGLLLEKIKEDRGLDFKHYHQELLKRRVAIRMRATNIDNYPDYLRLLIRNPEEYEKLFEVMCINVSEFFRDPAVWVKVRIIFAELIRRKTRNNNKTIRIWSAGCANGEEPHTIAIKLLSLLQADILNFCVEIIATDVDKKSIKIAEKGEYAKDSLKNVSKKYLDRYFNQDKDIYRTKDDINKLITYRYLDLTSAEMVNDVDMVFCRNVFIYFDRSLQEQLLMKFYKALRPEGYLIMGQSETLVREAKTIFEEVDGNARIYQRKD